MPAGSTSICHCGGATCCGCDYCGRPLCDDHACDVEALRHLGWDLLPEARALCPPCHGEQYWQLIEQRRLLWGCPILLLAVLVVSLLPLPGWTRFGLTAAFGLVLTASVLVTHLRKNRYLETRAREAASNPPTP